MDIQTKLIRLYCAVCHHYNTTLVAHAQRQSNNFRPKFTDEECITILIWGISNRKFEVKACYEFIRDYYGEWFPDLPSCQDFNNRVCNQDLWWISSFNQVLSPPGHSSRCAGLYRLKLRKPQPQIPQ